MKSKGFTVVELLIVLPIAAIFSAIIGVQVYSYYQRISGEKLANSTFILAKSYERYLQDNYTAYANLFRYYPSGKVTVPLKTLVQLNYLSSNVPALNRFKQSPCLAIQMVSNQLQGVLYFEVTPQSKPMSKNTLGLASRQLGSIAAIYDGTNVISEGKGWSLDPSEWFNNSNIINPYNASSSQPIYMNQAGLDASNYACLDTGIASNSIVVNLLEDYKMNAMLESDNAFHQYQDFMTARPDDQNNGNVIKGTLNLDSSNDPTANNPDPYSRTPDLARVNKLVFQTNPNCQPSPSDSSCTNKQLAISVTGNDLVIQGFQSSYIPLSGGTQQNVGSLKAYTIQPTTLITVGSDMVGTDYACDAAHVGSLAQQAPDQIYGQFYVSQVMCQQNPLCNTSSGYCYMPVNTVSIEFHPNVANAQCPAGYVMSNYNLEKAINPSCYVPGEWDSSSCDAHDVSPNPDNSFNIVKNLNGLNIGISSSQSVWRWTCGVNPNSGGGVQERNPSNAGVVVRCHGPAMTGSEAAITEPVITSMTCTNDLSKYTFQN